ncbi:hypothetical protein ACVIHI_007241 [Bradyrhizobium sp. USDA 4524]
MAEHPPRRLEILKDLVRIHHVGPERGRKAQDQCQQQQCEQRMKTPGRCPGHGCAAARPIRAGAGHRSADRTVEQHADDQIAGKAFKMRD